jgi:hypothetical protein
MINESWRLYSKMYNDFWCTKWSTTIILQDWQHLYLSSKHLINASVT